MAVARRVSFEEHLIQKVKEGKDGYIEYILGWIDDGLYPDQLTPQARLLLPLNDSGNNVLAIAAFNNKPELVRKLVEKGGVFHKSYTDCNRLSKEVMAALKGVKWDDACFYDAKLYYRLEEILITHGQGKTDKKNEEFIEIEFYLSLLLNANNFFHEIFKGSRLPTGSIKCSSFVFRFCSFDVIKLFLNYGLQFTNEDFPSIWRSSAEHIEEILKFFIERQGLNNNPTANAFQIANIIKHQDLTAEQKMRVLAIHFQYPVDWNYQGESLVFMTVGNCWGITSLFAKHGADLTQLDSQGYTLLQRWAFFANDARVVDFNFAAFLREIDYLLSTNINVFHEVKGKNALELVFDCILAKQNNPEFHQQPIIPSLFLQQLLSYIQQNHPQSCGDVNHRLYQREREFNQKVKEKPFQDQIDANTAKIKKLEKDISHLQQQQAASIRIRDAVRQKSQVTEEKNVPDIFKKQYEEFKAVFLRLKKAKSKCNIDRLIITLATEFTKDLRELQFKMAKMGYEVNSLTLGVLQEFSRHGQRLQSNPRAQSELIAAMLVGVSLAEGDKPLLFSSVIQNVGGNPFAVRNNREPEYVTNEKALSYR